MILPALGLHVEISTADGLAQYRWDANARDPGNRPQAMSCGSSIMNGYTTAGTSLARNINRGYPDLGLYDTIRFVGDDGQVAYEGRGSRFPRDASTVHRISAEAVGWMTHARDRPILFMGIDGRLSSWQQATGALDSILRTAGYNPVGPGTNSWDVFTQEWTGPWVAGELPISVAFFDAGPGQTIGSIYYSSTPGINTDEIGNFDWRVLGSVDRELVTTTSTGNLSGAPPNSGTFTAATGQRYAALQFDAIYTGAGTEGITYNLNWNRAVVYGSHGLPQIGPAIPYGLAGSDIIKYTAGIAAPLLDTTGVQTTTHPIEQFVFNETPTAVYEMWLTANQYERWNLAVWDNRKLFYEPLPDVAGLQGADWVLRSDHPNGLRRSYDGPTTDGSKNGVIVRYQNILTGAADMIDPTTTPSLADTDTRLAANRAGVQDWVAIQLPNPNSPTGAAKIGVAALSEFNRQRTPGRFVITGHIRDAADNWHPGWSVRAGQTVLLEEDEDDPIRVIHEVGWSQDSRELTISADAASKTLDAIIADMNI